MRLRGTKGADAAQGRIFSQLIPKLASGSVWWGAGIEPAMGYDGFRKSVRLCTYADLEPHIERMKKGEPDVLWPGTCQIYASTSGTSTGSSRLIPVTEAMLGHFKRAGLDSIFWYCARMGSSSVFRGRHLSLGGSTALVPLKDSEPFEAYSGDMSAIAALNLPRWAERAFSEPGGATSQIADWNERVAAIAAKAPGADVSLIAGMPRWVLDVAATLRARAAGGARPAANLKAMWPRLECFIHGGVPATPFHEELKGALGPAVNFHEIYSASEAFIAAQDSEPKDGLRLMADLGVFYEFLPMSEFDEAQVPMLGAKAVPLSGVQTGVDYALVITTPAGLARYVIGDVVRFLSTEPPRLCYVGRTDLRLNAFGEHVSEKEITDALIAVCRRNGWTIVNFHVAPLFNPPASALRGRHEWWVELKAGTFITPTGPVIAPELDAELRKLSAGYAAKRSGGVLDAPFVRLVMPGVFEHWMRYHKKWGGNNKMPRCRGDRVIADDLGAALQFAKD